MIQVLYIEDDQEIGEFVQNVFMKQGYEVNWLKSGVNFESCLKEVDIVVLDVMLPGLDGFTLGQRIKGLRRDIPILYLTALTAIEDKIKGLEKADDYLTKPFDPRELIIRIEKLLYRFDRKRTNLFKIKHLEVDLEANQIIDTQKKEEIFLTGIQFKILSYLLKNTNQILTKEQIYSQVWKDQYIEGDKTVTVHIKYLRDKIEKDPKNPLIIETIRGLGYRIKI